MSISDFKAEFAVLLKRHALPSSSVASPTKKSANHQELLDAVRDVLRSVLEVKLQYLDEAALKTPANNEIVVATPHAPDVLRVDYNQNASRFESFNVESGLKLPGHHSLHTHFEEKAQVLDNDHANNNNKEAKNANLHSTSSAPKPSQQDQCKLLLSHIVEDSQQNLQKVLSSLRRMADILRPEPQHAAAVRRLSTILNPAGSAKKPAPPSTTSLRSTIQRAKAARRSLAGDDVVTTPTTSRPSLPGGLPPHMTTLGKNKPVAPVSKLAQHSVGGAWTSVGDKPKSPVKLTKNPKYAHVQSRVHSVIPRPVQAQAAAKKTA